MPTITLSKKTIEKLVGRKMPVDQLKERISMLGTDLEKIEGDEIIVEVFPNRPDMLSDQSFARALSSFTGASTGLKEYKAKKPEKDYEVKITPETRNIRPFTACAIIKNLVFNQERIRQVIQIQEKLHAGMGRNRKKLAIGIYPLEHIKLPITYTAKKPQEIRFTPLESMKEMNGLQILKQHPAGREYGYLLRNKSLFPVFMDANQEVLSMPPIINSDKTGRVSEDTREVFVECSGFDFKVLSKCLNILVTTLADIGGEIYEMTLDYEKQKNKTTPELEPEEHTLDLEYVNKLLGLSLTEKQAQQLLKKMGYGCEGRRVLVPAYRTDILHQADLAEDIAIAYGYENFKPAIPDVSTIGSEDRFEVFKNRIAGILTGFGLLETTNYHLTSKQEHNNKMLFKAGMVELENALNKDYSALRTWVIPSLMKVLSENTNREYPQNIFEIGEVFKHCKKGHNTGHNTGPYTGIEENSRAGVVLCSAQADFTRIKQVFNTLMKALNTNYACEPAEHPSFIKGRVARMSVNAKRVAYIGEIHPQVLENFGIEMPVACFELNLTEFYNLMNKKL